MDSIGRVPLTNRLAVEVNGLGIVFQLERSVPLLLQLLRGQRYDFFWQRFGRSRFLIFDFAILFIRRVRSVPSADEGGQGESLQGQLHAYRSIGSSLFVVAAVAEVEAGRAMFFLAFLPRFLVILNDDLKERAI